MNGALPEDVVLKAIDYAISRGARLAIARFHERRRELIVFDGGALREYAFSVSSGVGVEVYSNGRGYSFTTSLSWDAVRRAVDTALELSKAQGRPVEFSSGGSGLLSYRSSYKVNPFTVAPEDKIRVVEEVNKEALRLEGIASSVTRMAFESDYRLVATSEGFRGESEVMLSGLAHSVVARQAGVMERVGDMRTFEGGFEHIESVDWLGFSDEVNKLALKVVSSKTPTPGSYRAIVDNELVGVVIHEALGHASEGDHVVSGTSVIAGMAGSRVAGEHVTIVDNGLVEGGYPVVFDDEGSAKVETVVVDRGVLKGYLTSRVVAGKLGLKPSGNARAEGYDNVPLVRQTNFYIKPGDWRVEELFEGFTGLYIRGKGMVGGGQVDPGNGMFSFNAGPSYVVRNGEIVEMVRGVLMAGSILEFLRGVEAVARDLKVETSVFGGCGKDGQLARVGLGGPHVRVSRVIVGGV
jgi:TldD protein